MFLTPEQTLASAQANLLSSYFGQGEGRGAVQCYLLDCTTQPYLCNYFFKNCITCGCHPLPQPWVQSVFQACLHLTWLLQGLCPLFQPCLSGPASKGHDPATCPKHLFMEGKKGTSL